MSALPPQSVTFSARDGRALACLLSEAAAARGALVVNGATDTAPKFTTDSPPLTVPLGVRIVKWQ